MSAIVGNGRKKILIVDNEPDWVEIISSALSKGNLFDVRSVENRKAAIQPDSRSERENSGAERQQSNRTRDAMKSEDFRKPTRAHRR